MSETALTELKLLQGYNFEVKFDLDGVPILAVDEQKPTGKGLGPNPTRLLSAALGHCLSSSLVYCLNKARVRIKNLQTTVRTSTARNPQGYLRINGVDVEIHLAVEEEDKQRIPRCLELFENYCTVTQSVRNGIDVKVRTVY